MQSRLGLVVLFIPLRIKQHWQFYKYDAFQIPGQETP